MECKRSILGGNSDFKLVPIPSVCQKAKTITHNVQGRITIFKDRRPEAIEWIETVLPTMWIGRREEILAAFWNTPDTYWFEFETGAKTLSICWIENKSSQ